MLPPITTFNERFGPVRYFMAPMAGITDTVFRSLIREMGAEVVISELISSEGILRRGQRTLDLMSFGEEERPVGIQVFGHKIEAMVESARYIQEMGADFVDINFGCPVKKVVCDGAGAGWLKDPIAMGKLLTEMKKVLRIPLTIKIRTGWDENSKNTYEVVKVAADCGVSWVAIHGRTRAQGYSGLADWELIRNVAQMSPIPVIGNGDILTADQARARIEQGYAHGVMIGRGALKNPWVFQEIAGIEADKNFVELVDRHFTLAIEKKGDKRAFLSLKKFLSWYATGFPGCSKFRQSLFGSNDVDELRALSLDYFRSVKDTHKETDNSPFLMGGHG